MEAAAREYARLAHKGQTYGEFDYTKHLSDVVTILRNFGYDDEFTLACGWLHDVVEDTDNDIYDVEIAFGPKMAATVKFLTDAKGQTRRLRKRETYADVFRYIVSWEDDPLNKSYEHPVVHGMRVKLADRLANVQSCIDSKNMGLYRMYQKECEVFRLAYFSCGVCDDMWKEYDNLLSIKFSREPTINKSSVVC